MKGTFIIPAEKHPELANLEAIIRKIPIEATLAWRNGTLKDTTPAAMNYQVSSETKDIISIFPVPTGNAHGIEGYLVTNQDRRLGRQYSTSQFFSFTFSEGEARYIFKLYFKPKNGQ